MEEIAIAKPKVMTVTQLKKHLKALSHKEALEMIVQLYQQSSQVQHILTTRFSGTEYYEQFAAEQKRIIQHALDPMRTKPDVTKFKQELEQTKQLPAKEALDVYLCYVQSLFELFELGFSVRSYERHCETIVQRCVEQLNSAPDAALLELYRPRLQAIHQIAYDLPQWEYFISESFYEIDGYEEED